MNRLRVLVDVDGTIAEFGKGYSIRPGEPLPGAIAWLKRLIADGRFEVVLYTSRCSIDMPAHRTQAREVQCWLEDNGIPERLPIIGHKAPAHVYIDDCGFRFEGTYPEPDAIAALRPWWDSQIPRL